MDKTIKIAEEFVNYVVEIGLDELSARDYGMRSSNADIVVSFSPDTVYPKGIAARLVKPMLDDQNLLMTTGRLSFQDPINNLFNAVSDGFANKRYKPQITAVRRDVYVESELDFGRFADAVATNEFKYVPTAIATVIR